jgi:RNA-dependent RNA polymerase
MLPFLQDIQHFFLEYMVNDSLGVICNAHVVEADLNPLGASSEKCRQLAVLACTAVDYPKTGHPAVLPRELCPQSYPDFMEKEDKPTYKSDNILGQLYRDVKERKTGDSLKAPKVGADVLVLDGALSFPGFEDHLEEAWHAKWYYDQELTEIMRKYRIETEAEVVTNCIASLSVYHQRPIKAHKVKERIREAFNAVKKHARNIFDHGLGGVEQEEPRLSRKVNEAEQLAKAYAYDYVTYSRDWRERKIAEGEVDETDPILLSFP